MNLIEKDRVLKITLTLFGGVGMVAGVVGLFLSPEVQRWWFLAGAICMMTTAWVHGERLFLVLQGVALVAIIASFLPFADWIKGSIPLVVFFFCIVLLSRRNGLQSALDWFGACSLFILSLGYALQHYVFFIVAGSLLVVFSGLEVKRGFKSAWLWLLLNLAFTISALINV